MNDENDIILKVEDMTLQFGNVAALWEVCFYVEREEILSIIGPNGAGKTSILNCINGFYKPKGGRIIYDSQDITKLPPYKIAQLGVSRTFQNIQLYTGLTTIDNMMASRNFMFKTGVFEWAFYFGRARREEIKHRRVVEKIIDFLRLEKWRDKRVGALPYGIRKVIDLGRALAMEPKLLLLDEPMAGMNIEEKEDMARHILDIQEQMGVTIIIIEHDMGVVMDISDRIMVLNFGNKIMEGLPKEVAADESVAAAYLGSE